MKNLITILIVFLVFISLTSCKNTDNQSIILQEVTVINIEDGQLSTTSLLIKNGLIKEIGDFSQLAKNNSIKVIDCKGKYAIPGLIDMHTHISETQKSYP